MKVYQTFKNSDMTEGRGHMVPDLCFSKRELAASYIDEKPGAMGRRAKWSTMRYGDWEVREIEVLDEWPPKQEGPKTVQVCTGCKHLGDVGKYGKDGAAYCLYGNPTNPRAINLFTPDWCPILIKSTT